MEKLKKIKIILKYQIQKTKIENQQIINFHSEKSTTLKNEFYGIIKYFKRN